MTRNRLVALVAGLALAASVGIPAQAATPVQPSPPAATHGGPPAQSKTDDHGRPPVHTTGPSEDLSAQMAPPSAQVVRHYTGGYDFATNDGAFAGMKLRDNYKDSASYHNITEMSVEQSAADNIVEIGWGKGSFCSTSANCLFGYHWVNGVPQGYNVGFQDYAATNLNLGEALAGETAGCASGSTKNERFGIRKLMNGWGLWADLCYGDSGTGSAGQYIGEFPFTRWTSQGTSMTSSDLVQVFNETAVQYTPGSSTDDGYPCDDQGGSLASPTSGTGMRLADLKLQGVLDSAVNMTPFAVSSGGYYDADMPGHYEAHPLTGQPVGNVRYVNAGGLGFGATPGNTAGSLNC